MTTTITTTASSSLNIKPGDLVRIGGGSPVYDISEKAVGTVLSIVVAGPGAEDFWGGSIARVLFVAAPVMDGSGETIKTIEVYVYRLLPVIGDNIKL